MFTKYIETDDFDTFVLLLSLFLMGNILFKLMERKSCGDACMLRLIHSNILKFVRNCLLFFSLCFVAR